MKKDSDRMKVKGLEIEIEEIEEDGIVMMRLFGRIDTRTCDTLQKAIQEVFNSGFYRIVLDVSKIEYFSSAGLGVFINCSTRATENDGNLVLMNPPPQVSTLLMLIGATDTLSIAPDFPSALTMF
jgi:anti-sigma B factor antagonist